MRRVLLTGAGGFVAGHLIPSLLAVGDMVFGMGRAPVAPELRERIAGEWQLDLADETALRDALRASRPDAIIHLAAQSSAGGSFREPVETFRANVAGTWSLLRAVREVAQRARVLVVGSGEVYGPVPPGSRASEDSVFQPVSPYALSKCVVDVMAERAALHLELDVVRTRSFAHTGPGQTATFAIPAWARQIAAIERGEMPPVLAVGNLDVERDLTHVRDVVDAYRLLLERGTSGGVYNVCRGQGVSLRSVAERLCSLSSVLVRIETDVGRLRPADVPHLVGNPARIQGETGWRASTPLDRTLADVLDDWRSRREPE